MDYGHTFSKIIEMVPNADIMHGEAVNVDGFLSLVISKRRGMISTAVLERVFSTMKNIGLPTIHDAVELKLMEKVRHYVGAMILEYYIAIERLVSYMSRFDPPLIRQWSKYMDVAKIDEQSTSLKEKLERGRKETRKKQHKLRRKKQVCRTGIPSLGALVSFCFQCSSKGGLFLYSIRHTSRVCFYVGNEIFFST